jgi:hypothetical protein
LRVEGLLRTETRLRGDLQKALADEQTSQAGEAAAKREVAYLNYAHSVDLAHREYHANNVGRARELLDGCPVDLRGWEWHHVHRLCHADLATLTGHTGLVLSALFSGDGRRVVTASADHTARVWDADTGEELAALRGHTGGVRSASFSVLTGRFSDDGTRVLTAGRDGPVEREGSRVVRVIVYDSRPVNRAFLPPPELAPPPRLRSSLHGPCPGDRPGS